MKRITFAAMVVATALMSACNNPDTGVKEDTPQEATVDTAVMYEDEKGRVDADGMEVKKVDDSFWNDVNFEAPVVDAPALKTVNVEKRATNDYTIYTMEEKVMFDTDKAAIRQDAEPKLQEIAKEIKNIPGNGAIRIYGFTDARASKDYNKELGQERAKAVQDWLQNNGGIDASRLSVQSMGEEAPAASNETAAGRQMNRRVAIVVATNTK
ncbi:OmpA family protein [Pontibacter liquoris]|uniref:OmpA family protein n=1 Tax=Pontibacter liquoris TaxID=2905677 RepID=UPI001FA7B03E|nr:OmpA family protein [Pontibacter liquoris]